MQPSELAALAFPVERVHEAMLAMGLSAGYLRGAPATLLTSPAHVSPDAIEPWFLHAAEQLGLNAEPTSILYEETELALRRIGPALVSVDDAQRSWLAIVSSDHAHVRVYTPSGRIERLPLATVRRLVAQDLDREGDALIEPMLGAAGLSGRLGDRARQHLRHQLRSQRRIRRAFMLRHHPAAGFRVLLRDARIVQPLLVLLGSHLLGTLALVLSWLALGSGALSGRLDPGWLAAAALLGLSQLPLRSLGMWAQGMFALEAARVLKLRLLNGALRIDRDEIRRDGAGHLVARVMESEAIESLALNGGLGAALASIEVALAVTVLGSCRAYWVLGVLAVFVVLGAVCQARLAARNRAFTDARLELTHDLIERMVGHRTRITQERPSRWHEQEDLALSRAGGLARASDASETQLGFLHRIFLGLAVAALMPLWIAGADSARLAGAVGAVLLAHGAFTKLSGGIEQLVRAWISMSRIRPLLEAARLRPVPGEAAFGVGEAGPGKGPVLELRGASLRYPGRPEPALRDVSLKVQARDRILCVGPSGGGKSSLAQLLSAIRTPNAGLVLSKGLDLGAVGEQEWRARTVLVPQFHENHVFVSSLAFNLLMGVSWPPEQDDLERAEELCRELGLGPLLDRMPSGLMQPVGDSGWQLSHGERSRVFLARALLCKKAQLLVLDESFGALDPTTLERCVRVTMERAPALLVIAHP